ncbi:MULTISPECIES: hypothetical protein [unclassified Streptomyces]|uniref:hypothetical protein n=1 Tax=unclassified Streptomyces TaxID=2593676 RepID=UPI0033BBF670
MHDAPIYAQLISERGDIPLQVRNEARRLQRELDWVLNWGPAPGGLLPQQPAAPAPSSPQLQLGAGTTDWFA